MKVFMHTNVMLDVLAQQEPHYADSSRVWTLAETGRVEAFVSAISLPTLNYRLCRTKGPKPARKAMSILRDIFGLVALDAQIVNQAIDSDIDDFEDAIQFFSALRADAAVLITRNAKDFPSQDIAIQTPEEFLATHFARG
jgi:predicted nucleic acid-binding protein